MDNDIFFEHDRLKINYEGLSKSYDNLLEKYDKVCKEREQLAVELFEYRSKDRQNEKRT